MKPDAEISALRKHFESRGLDLADGSTVALLWLAVNAGLAAGDEADLNRRIDSAADYLRTEAGKIARAIQGDSTGGRLQ